MEMNKNCTIKYEIPNGPIIQTAFVDEYGHPRWWCGVEGIEPHYLVTINNITTICAHPDDVYLGDDLPPPSKIYVFRTPTTEYEIESYKEYSKMVVNEFNLRNSRCYNE